MSSYMLSSSSIWFIILCNAGGMFLCPDNLFGSNGASFDVELSCCERGVSFPLSFPSGIFSGNVEGGPDHATKSPTISDIQNK